MSALQRQIVVVFVFVFFVGILGGCANSAIQISPTSALLLPGEKSQFQAITNTPNATQYLWQVNGVIGGSASTGTITPGGLYTAPSTATTQPIQVSVQKQHSVATVSIFDPSHTSQGNIAATQNPLVAAYTSPVPLGASVQVQFGTDNTYGLSTSTVAAPPGGGKVTVLVGGMLASTTYHMQAVVKMADGSNYMDGDHTFATGAIPADRLPNISTLLTGVGTPSPGIELLSLQPFNPKGGGNPLLAVATDLAGNVIWYYDLPANTAPFPIKPLPNGHMLVLAAPFEGQTGGANDLREIDLAGNIIHQVTIDEINKSLAKTGASFQLGQLSHDVVALPNGHLILLADYTKTINNVSGIPAGTAVLGDVLIDWDLEKGAAVWTWSSFDHLDLTRAPYGISDWTHGNAVIYSPDDGNLILSLRNQNWVLKINYSDGTGDGSILWRLGPGGDFTLPSLGAPTEWNYGQHYPTIQSPNSSGIFSLMLFNNGNNRLVDSNNDVCGSSGATGCYSSVPIFQLDEYTKTASVLWEDNLSPAYSVCCGDALILPSGSVEFDIAYDVNNPNVSSIEEVIPTQSPELIWRMNIQGLLAYRGFRIPSLYPGQVWPANTPQNLRANVHH
jgi:hypothetical protein